MANNLTGAGTTTEEKTTPVLEAPKSDVNPYDIKNITEQQQKEGEAALLAEKEPITETPVIEPEPTLEIKVPEPAPEIKVPEPTPTPKKEEPTVITSLSEFKTAGSNLDNLVNFLENSPREQTENVQIIGNKVTGSRDGERFEWSIDKAGNPVRKSLGIVDNEKETFAKNAGISFDTDNKGQITFKPDSLDDVLGLYNQFGTKINIAKDSIETIKGTAVWEKYNKYKGASEDVYIDGLKAGEIAEGGETWNALIKLNGGEPTAEMIAARDSYDGYLKANNINENAKITYNAFGGEVTTGTDSTEQSFRDAATKLDTDYLKAKTDLFTNIEAQYEVYKTGSEETNELRKKAQETASQIDELNIEKRNIIKNVKERHPNLPLSMQLKIARDETEVVNDELFALQRQYNIDNADYQYADTQDKAEFEFNMKILEQKGGLMDDLYGITRGDILRQEDIARADRLLKGQIERAEADKKAAIAANDANLAKKYAYDLALLEEKDKLNKKAFQGFSTKGGLMVFNPNTGEVEFKQADGVIEAEEATPTIDSTGRIVGTTYGLASGKTKTIRVDEVAQDSLNNIIAELGIDQTGKMVSSPGDTILIGSHYRSKEEQQKLYDAYKSGKLGLAAKPGTSKHEKGMAIDIYANSNFDPLNAEQTATMNKNGWYQTAGKNDLGHFEYLGEQDTGITTGLASYDKLRPIDKTNAINYLAAKERGAIDFKKEAAVPEDIKKAADAMSLELSKMKKDNPGLSGLFSILSKGGAKLSNEEGANIQKAELEFAITGDEDAFIDQIRHLAQKTILSEDVDIKNAKKNMIQLDRTAALLESMDSNKWKGIQKDLTDMAGLSTAKDFDEAKTRLGLEASAFVKEISGAAVTDEEFQRLSALLPSLGDTPKLALNKLAEFRRTRFEALTEPAISLLGNKRDVFEKIYPELKGGGVYKGKTDTVDDYINGLETGGGPTYSTSSEADDYINSLYPNK